MTETQLPETACSVFEAMETRRSVRAFLPTPVPQAVVEHILALASRAPSASNIQPWKVWATSGKARDRITEKIVEAYLADDGSQVDEWHHYPQVWTEPYLSRRRRLGIDLYRLAGIRKGDIEAMRQHGVRNLRLFGAPVGLFVTVERQMEIGSWIDIGTFVQSVLLAARGYGLDACAQGIFARFHKIIRAELDIPDSEIVVCAIALGHADPESPLNKLVTEREPVSVFTKFYED